MQLLSFLNHLTDLAPAFGVATLGIAIGCGVNSSTKVLWRRGSKELGPFPAKFSWKVSREIKELDYENNLKGKLIKEREKPTISPIMLCNVRKSEGKRIDLSWTRTADLPNPHIK